MNLKITNNWLKEYLDTDADPNELQKYLSLSGPSVERVEKTGNDYVYDIEVTSNRVDMASVFGISLEAQAILPQFGKKARSKKNPLEEYKFTCLVLPDKESAELTIKITNHEFCPRFAAVVVEGTVGDSPDFIRQRLTLSGIKSISNIVDISNYLMLDLGQPVHMFDYDKITGKKLVLRESLKDEEITTLDGKKIILPGGDIVIEDGSGRLIDLCGIMGGLNSSVDAQTKRVILFVQTYDKKRIRRSSMKTGQRTVAATYFEKGLDPERVEPTLVYGIKLLEKYAKGKIISPLYDIYPEPYKQKVIGVSQYDIDRIIGVSIDKEKVTSILTNLGFQVETRKENGLTHYQVLIPSFRSADIKIKEDIIEEIARIYGYYNLPNNIQPCAYTKQPQELGNLFDCQERIKYHLKDIGIHEVINYSMVSDHLIETLKLEKKDHLMIANTLSEEIKYMRRSLLPSLVKNIRDNQGKKEVLKFFEIAKVYLPKNNDLPNEVYRLGLAVNTDFFDLKGIIESVLDELNINNYHVRKSKHRLMTEGVGAEVVFKEKVIGVFGQLKPVFQLVLGINKEIFIAEFDFHALSQLARTVPVYTPTNPYAIIKLDLTVKLRPDMSFEKIRQVAFQSSALVKNIEVVDIHKDNLTLRFYFTSLEKNITEEEAKKELNHIKMEIV
jgi:phenylalanyl-tRNA synthetase beta chain